jgi:predicted phosphoadenosine phosphosulfate sulfurtransferase
MRAKLRRLASINVVEASKIRLVNAFSSGVPIYLSFSGGKDSLCMVHLVVKLIKEGIITTQNLTVQFIDEEAIFPCIQDIVEEWRARFLSLGAKFEWYCIEVKHFNCFNQLENDESFICFDSTKQNDWIRQPPSFALTSHPALRPRFDTYQQFLGRISRGGISIIGLRGFESVQRLSCIADIIKPYRFYPLYDWHDNDVWLYLKENNIAFPQVYIYLWQLGLPNNALRISQFFSIDTAGSLVRMNEFYPNLMDKIIKREPNAYLASLYWDSAMFRRNTHKRRLLETEADSNNYQTLFFDLLADINSNFNTPLKRQIAHRYKSEIMGKCQFFTEKHYRQLYMGLKNGDPKTRVLRGVIYGAIHNAKQRVIKNGQLKTTSPKSPLG